MMVSFPRIPNFGPDRASLFLLCSFLCSSFLHPSTLASSQIPECSSPVQTTSQQFPLQSSKYILQCHHQMPWTHEPVCLPTSPSATDAPAKEFCTYTNTHYASGRGISFITSPSAAISLSTTQFQSSPYTIPRDLSPNPPPYESKTTQDRGIGLYANSSLTAGETIMIHTPLLVLARDALDHLSRDQRHELQTRAMSQLPALSQNLFFNLVRSRGGNAIDDIVQTNSIRISMGEVGYLVVVPEAARINHACRPNAYYRFNESTLALEVFALRDIGVGEELTFSYGYSTHPSYPRQTALHTHWSFTCTCPLCASPPALLSASDARLARIATIQSLLPGAFSNPRTLGELVTELVNLYEEESLIVQRPRYEEILAYTWAGLGDEEQVRYWGRRAMRGWSVVAGRESWEVLRMRELVRDVRGHGSWRGGI